MIDIIKQRKSVRTFSNTAIEKATIDLITEYLSANKTGPFGNKVRFDLVSASEGDKKELKALGTYGMIKGAQLYVAGTVEMGPKAMEDFGYCMENNILMLTKIGLGTCWLGGTFSRSAFGRKMNVTGNEVVPAVSPIGYPLEKRSTRESLIRFIAGSKNRKNFSELFFYGDLSIPCDYHENEPYSIALECVWLAPSASNKQPWRVIQEKEQPVYHFFLKENSVYNNVFREVKLQNVDMGIAMCHFESAARELGLEGNWQIEKPSLCPAELTYIASWSQEVR